MKQSVNCRFCGGPRPTRYGRCRGCAMEVHGARHTMIERLARFREYLDTRHGSGCGDQGHGKAIKEQNKMAEKVRKALGFTYPKRDVNF